MAMQNKAIAIAAIIAVSAVFAATPFVVAHDAQAFFAGGRGGFFHGGGFFHRGFGFGGFRGGFGFPGWGGGWGGCGGGCGCGGWGW